MEKHQIRRTSGEIHRTRGYGFPLSIAARNPLKDENNPSHSPFPAFLLTLEGVWGRAGQRLPHKTASAPHLEHLECGMQPRSRDARLRSPDNQYVGTVWRARAPMWGTRGQKTRSNAGRRHRVCAARRPLTHISLSPGYRQGRHGRGQSGYFGPRSRIPLSIAVSAAWALGHL